MPRFYGKVGYAESTETSPGVWTDIVTIRNYYGDVNRISKRSQVGEGLNDNIVINNEISILADPYAYEHFQAMKFIQWMGAFWKISSIEVQRPRLILTIGGVYNGETTAVT
jgi:hypothetical protein